PAGLQLLNDLLLVIIILELFRTVVRFLQTEVLTVEPYLAVGIIACTRRILTASAELSHLPEVTKELFDRYVWDVALNVAVILVLIIAVFVLRCQRPGQAGPTPYHFVSRACALKRHGAQALSDTRPILREMGVFWL